MFSPLFFGFFYDFPIFPLFILETNELSPRRGEVLKIVLPKDETPAQQLVEKVPEKQAGFSEKLALRPNTEKFSSLIETAEASTPSTSSFEDPGNRSANRRNQKRNRKEEKKQKKKRNKSMKKKPKPKKIRRLEKKKGEKQGLSLLVKERNDKFFLFPFFFSFLDSWFLSLSNFLYSSFSFLFVHSF